MPQCIIYTLFPTDTIYCFSTFVPPKQNQQGAITIKNEKRLKN